MCQFTAAVIVGATTLSHYSDSEVIQHSIAQKTEVTE